MLWFQTMREVIKCTCEAFRGTADATNADLPVISDTCKVRMGSDNGLQ
jgi:hypothetical protein